VCAYVIYIYINGVTEDIIILVGPRPYFVFIQYIDFFFQRIFLCRDLYENGLLLENHEKTV